MLKSMRSRSKETQLKELRPTTIHTSLWTKIQVVLLFVLLGLNGLALRKEPKYLIQSSSSGQLSEARPGKEKPELARAFVRTILPLLFWYTKNPPVGLGVKAQDTYVYGNIKIWIPNAEASYALAGNLQTAFLKGLAKYDYPKIKQLGAASRVLYPLVVTTPQSLGNGQWQGYFAGEKFFYDEKGQMISKEDFRVKVTLQEVEPPDKPIGGLSAVDRVVYEARLTGFVIVGIEEAPGAIK